MHDGKLYKTVCPQEDKLTGVVRDSGACLSIVNFSDKPLKEIGLSMLGIEWADQGYPQPIRFLIVEITTK
jgi:hypothetical protein